MGRFKIEFERNGKVHTVSGEAANFEFELKRESVDVTPQGGKFTEIEGAGVELVRFSAKVSEDKLQMNERVL